MRRKCTVIIESKLRRVEMLYILNYAFYNTKSEYCLSK